MLTLYGVRGMRARVRGKLQELGRGEGINLPLTGPIASAILTQLARVWERGKVYRRRRMSGGCQEKKEGWRVMRCSRVLTKNIVSVVVSLRVKCRAL